MPLRSFFLLVVALGASGASTALAEEGGDILGAIHRSLTGATDAIATEQNSRACGEVIDTVMPGDPFLPVPNLQETNTLNYGINALIQGFGTFFASGGAAPLIFTDYYGIFLDSVNRNSSDASQFYSAQYGIKVVKVCGRCGDYKLKDKALKAAYNEYCGKHVYGRDAKFSGVALIPVDGHGRPVEGAMKGAISSTSIQTDAFQTASVKWLSHEQGGVGAMARTDAGLYMNFVPAMMAAATGQFVGLIVDNMGYGESSDCFKGVYVKKSYQTPILPLWLATQDLVAGESKCATELIDKVVINGQSEGGFGALAMAEALDGIGVKIILVQAGALADLDATTSLSISSIINSNLDTRFSYSFVMVGSAFSSSRPDLPNYGIVGQGLLSKMFRGKAVIWAQANLEIPDMRLLVNNILGPALNNTDTLNPAVVDAVESDNLICKDPTASGLKHLCAAISENQVVTTLPSVDYPVEICHSPNDDLVPFNTDAYGHNNNPYVSLKPTKAAWDGIFSFPITNRYIHAATLATCLAMQGWTLVDDTTLVETNGKCKRNRKSKKKKSKTSSSSSSM